MIYKLEIYDKMTEAGTIFFSAMRQAIKLPEFLDVLIDLEIPEGIVSKALDGCRRCWSDLENIINKNKSDAIVVKLNSLMQTLDVEGKLKINPASKLAVGRQGKFKNKEDALEYLKGIRVFNSITISFR